MKETIRLEAIDPIEIYGAANRNLEALCNYFPNMKVAARGNEIHLDGCIEDVESFKAKLNLLIQRRHHKTAITPYDVEDIFDGEASQDRFRLNGDAVIVHGNDGKPIKARNRTQEEMVKAYFENDLIFAVGPAGTGKTYIAIALAVRALKNREIKRIILTRPAVEAGERLGFLPGDLKDKLDPYLQPHRYWQPQLMPMILKIHRILQSNRLWLNLQRLNLQRLNLFQLSTKSTRQIRQFQCVNMVGDRPLQFMSA